MSQDQLRNALDAIRARLQAELDDQFATLEQQQARAVDEIRRASEAEIEQRWAARVEAVRAEWASRLESERAAADTEAARRGVAERERLATELDSERRQLQAVAAELEEARSALTREREAAQSAGVESTPSMMDAQLSERQAQMISIERLLGAVRTIGSAPSLSETLRALLTTASAEAPRVALFIVNRMQLQGWKAAGFDLPPTDLRLDHDEDGALREALVSGRAVSTSAAAPPAFAALSPDRAGLAVPIIVGGQPVALLYADDGSREAHLAPAAWPEAVQLLSLHAAERLAYLTALRTAQAMRLVPAHGGTPARPSEELGETNAARRYARLLVAEIKLYNEPAVRLGREHRDLLERLGSEITRARRLYEQRVPASVAARDQYFDQELVQTLAGGDPVLLGTSGVKT